MRALTLPTLLAVVFAGTGCVGVSNLQQPAATPTPTPAGDREDCGEIMGTAFRSSAERGWFAENCSAWAATTLGPVENPTGAGTARQTGDSRDGREEGDRDEREDRRDDDHRDEGDDRQDDARGCAEMRGRPYEQPGDRQWFHEHCLNGSTATDDEPQTWDCNQLRGRPYESPEQRQWYLANCQNPGPANAGGGGGGAIGPNGRGCNEIYGTRFRSSSERSWFSQNCPH